MDISLLLPVVRTSAPNLFEMDMRRLPRIRDCRFSSASPNVRPYKEWRKNRLGLIEDLMDRQQLEPDAEVLARAHGRRQSDPLEEYSLGMPMPITFSAPSASTAIAATRAESMPPLKSYERLRKTAFAYVVSRAEDEGVPHGGDLIAGSVFVSCGTFALAEGCINSDPFPAAGTALPVEYHRRSDTSPCFRDCSLEEDDVFRRTKPPARATLPSGANDDRGAVEDETVVAADLVDHRDDTRYDALPALPASRGGPSRLSRQNGEAEMFRMTR